MDQGSAVKVGVAALVAVLLVVAYFVRESRRREMKQRIGEYLAGYFSGDVALDQLIRRTREGASPSFIGSPECQALVQAAFQRTAEAKLAREGHSLDAERKLLAALAAVRAEFGLPERYQNEGWKAGRE